MSDYQRQKDAFLHALDLAADERGAYLEMLSRSDPQLGSRVREQLEATDRPVRLLDRADGSPPVPTLPQYRLIRELGRGGMGRVWLAERQLGDATQRVALKQIAHGVWTQQDRRRFERERRILASLQHPHIAALVDGGTDAAGAPWLATVFVEGKHLDRFAQVHALPLAARVRLLAKVAGAVAHAHRHLVVHRDLKPANILVEEDGEPRLLDFGIARLLDDDAPTVTTDSQMTLRYAAPEQVRGEDAATGVATDIHALGVLLYELLAGVSPHGEGRDPAGLIRAILEVQPLPPSAHRGGAVIGVDGDLDAIVLKALRKRPAERYASAEALNDDLGRWLAREPVAARRGESGYRARTFLRRRWPVVAAVSVLLAAGAGFTVYDRARTNHELAALVQERDKAQQLADYFRDLFKTAPPAATAGDEISARELLERSIATLREDSQRPPETRARLLLAAADALAYLGRNAESRDAYAHAVDLLRSAGTTDSHLLAGALGSLASQREASGDLAGARRDIADAIEIERAWQPAGSDLQLSLVHRAATFANAAGDVQAARTGYSEVAARARARLGSPDVLRSYLSAQVNLATIELSSGSDATAAEARLREALAAADARGFDNPATLLPMRASLVRALYEQGRLADASALFDPLLTDARTWYAPGDLWLAFVLAQGGTLALLEKRATDSMRFFDESLAIYSRLGPEHRHVKGVASGRALASLAAGNWTEAAARLETTLAGMEASPQSAATAKFYRAALAYARCRQQPDEEARQAWEHAVADVGELKGWRRQVADGWQGCPRAR